MDRLREVLANSGIALGQAQVGAESSGQSANGEPGGNRHGGNLAAGITDTSPAATAWTRHSNNMLDVFA
jgi:flagellar hook-length control protein FliK